MPNPPETDERILAAIHEKVPELGPCSICRTSSGYVLAEGFVSLVLQSFGATGFVIGGQALPCIALTCRRCGNTVLLNAYVLGLGELLAPVMKETPPSPTQPLVVPSVARATETSGQ